MSGGLEDPSRLGESNDKRPCHAPISIWCGGAAFFSCKDDERRGSEDRRRETRTEKKRESKAGKQLNRVDTNWLGHDMENRQQRTSRLETRPTGRGLGWEEEGKRERTGRGGKRRGSEQGERTRLSSHSLARHPRRRAAEWRCRWCLLILWGRDACRACLCHLFLFFLLVWCGTRRIAVLQQRLALRPCLLIAPIVIQRARAPS